MKIDSNVKKETLNIAISVTICSAIMQIIFLVFGKYDITVLFGSLYGIAVAVLNFFLMGLAIQSATKTDDENSAKKKLQVTYTFRQLLLFGLVAVGVALECFHWLPVMLTLFFPTISIYFRRFVLKQGLEDNLSSEEDAE